MVDPLNFIGIIFSTNKDEELGDPIIHRAGPVMYTKSERSYIVPESTTALLEDLKINFKKVPASTFSVGEPSTKTSDIVQEEKAPVRSTKVPRNAPCPCGSGKKFKKCCGKST